MKPIHQRALQTRLLYGVILVLTTSLLLVGGAYRLKTWEAQNTKEILTSINSNQKHQIRELQAQITKESKAREEDAQWREANGFTDTSDPRYGPPPGVELLNNQWKSDKQYIRALEARLKAYKDAYPEPPTNWVSINSTLSERVGDSGTRVNLDVNVPISTEGQRVTRKDSYTDAD